MQIISIEIDQTDRGPALRLVFSDGITPSDGIVACETAAAQFREMELQRRVREALERQNDGDNSCGGDDKGS